MRSTGQLHAPADLIPEKPRYTFNRKLNEPRTLLWRRDKLLALLRIKLWTKYPNFKFVLFFIVFD
jgi:hypothetical protein